MMSINNQTQEINIAEPMKNVQLLSQKLRLISYFYNRNLARELAQIKVNHHFEMLLILAQQDQPVTQSQLADLLHIDKSRIANIVFALEEKKMVIVKTGKDDRRRHYVSLSPDALQFIPYIEKKVQEVNEQANNGISEQKLNIFLEVSEIIMQNLLKSKPGTV
jgi:DNA-binding MarR family transcriptional regulator